MTGNRADGVDRPSLMPAGEGSIVRAGLRRFDRLFDGIVGGFGVLFLLQTADSFVAALPSMSNAAGPVVIALVGVSAVVGLIPVLMPTWSRRGFVLASACYAAALLLWPVAIQSPVPTDPMPWLVATWPGAAAYLARTARSRVLPVVAAAAAGGFAGGVLHLRGGVGTVDAAVNGFFMIGIAVVLVLLLGTVRRGVVAAAETQQGVVDRFAAVELEDATEAERARTDALLHDAVLTTFLSAASASTPESEDLVSRMAVNSLRVLMHVNGVGRGNEVLPLGQALAEERERLDPLLAHFESELSAVQSVMLPEAVARALVEVTIETMRNSLLHAEPATRRTARAHRLGPDGVRVVVEDDGRGFDPAVVRASGAGGRGAEAMRRFRAVEGRVDLRSEPGTGARVTSTWGSVAIVGTELLADEATGVLS